VNGDADVLLISRAMFVLKSVEVSASIHHNPLMMDSLLALEDIHFFRSLAISVNGANGLSDIEGKAAREAVSECGQRASFNSARAA
jgi:hypothetical protein